MINKPGVELAEHDRFMSRKAGSTQEDIARATSCAALLRALADRGPRGYGGRHTRFGLQDQATTARSSLPAQACDLRRGLRQREQDAGAGVRDPLERDRVRAVISRRWWRATADAGLPVEPDAIIGIPVIRAAAARSSCGTSLAFNARARVECGRRVREYHNKRAWA